MKKLRTILCLVLTSQNKVLVGKHNAGVYENKWGFPSINVCDDRPQDSAKKLLEVSTLGLLGGISCTKKLCILQGKTIHGLAVYKVDVDSNLAEHITNATKYLSKCFALGASPPGMLAWKKCKMVSLEEAFKLSHIDDITREALEFLRLSFS
jgi:hypothetical protein